MSRFTMMVGGFLAVVSVACGGGVDAREPAPESTPVHDTGVNEGAAIVLECGAHSFLSVGTYSGRWADWRLTVDSTGRAHASLAVVDGPTASSDGYDPALDVHFPGDVSFLIWADNGRGHFVQPYPGLPAGYDVTSECVVR